MFFDIQVVTKNLHCLQMQISATSLPGHARIFQQYLQHTYVCTHIRWDVTEALTIPETQMPSSQVVEPAQQSQVVNKGQQQQHTRGQPTSFIVVDD